MEPLHTFADIVHQIQSREPNPTAFNYYEDGVWKSISTESFLFDLKRLTYGLIKLGLRRGDAVGILANSSPFWNLADLAIIMAGGVTVPLFAKISHENFVYECAQANIRFIFIQGEEQWQMYEEHRNLFEKVIAIDAPGDIQGALSFHEILKIGEKLWEEKPNLWDELITQIGSEDITTIIYTAGSTGMPKGVLLSNLNLCHLIGFNTFAWNNVTDRYLSILPLPHVFARQINLILMTWGISIYYLNDLSKMAQVSKEIKPTLMIVVPRVLEKMYSSIEGRISTDSNKFRKVLGSWALRLAADPSEAWHKRFILRPIADVLIYSKLRKALGDCWRVILCGGAALDPRLCLFYIRIGIPIYEGWGLTESSTICVNTPGQVKVGTVGKPLPGTKVKLGDNDELLIGGPTVMKGYYRNPDATFLAKTEDGWLHTGDKGVIDKEGFVKLIGRVKEQFKLSSGEYVAPSKIEHMLCQNPLIDMAMVIGEKRKYAACLLFPDFANIKKIKKAEKLEHLSDQEFLDSDYAKREIENLFLKVNSKVNTWEKLGGYQFILHTPTVESGEMTPTLKLKRDVILNKYKKNIDMIYGEEGR